MADANRAKLHPSLPANYVSFLDLRDRWMKKQQQQQNEPDDELRPKTIIEVDADVERVEAVVDEDKGFVADRRLESESPTQLAAESAVRSNPNPKNATRRPFHGHRRPTEKGHHHRWVQVSQTKSPPVLPLNTPNQAPKIQANQSEPDPKALPVLQSKPPPSEAPEVKHTVQAPTEIHSSDKEVNDSRFCRRKVKKTPWGKRSKKRNQEEDLVQSQPEKGVLAPNDDLEERAKLTVQPEKPQPLKAPKVVRSVHPRDEIHGSGEVVNDPNVDRAMAEKTKKKRKYKRRNQKVEDVIQSQPKKDPQSPNVDLNETENSNQEIDSVRENKDSSDNSKAEIEAKFASLSLGCAPEESSSYRSAAAKNRRGWRKDGSFAEYVRRLRLKQEQAKAESGFVWVKKGEASQSGMMV